MRRLLLTTALLPLAVPVTADAATRWVVGGGGWGHGLGMSQYGAYGQAKAGHDYKTIVHHYYRNTELGKAGGSVRVLLLASRVVGDVRAARTGWAAKSVDPGRTYTARRVGGRVVVCNRRGRRVARSSGVLRVLSPNGLVGVATKGRTYRDVIELRPGVCRRRHRRQQGRASRTTSAAWSRTSRRRAGRSRRSRRRRSPRARTRSAPTPATRSSTTTTRSRRRYTAGTAASTRGRTARSRAPPARSCGRAAR